MIEKWTLNDRSCLSLTESYIGATFENTKKLQRFTKKVFVLNCNVALFVLPTQPRSMYLVSYVLRDYSGAWWAQAENADKIYSVASLWFDSNASRIWVWFNCPSLCQKEKNLTHLAGCRNINQPILRSWQQELWHHPRQVWNVEIPYQSSTTYRVVHTQTPGARYCGSMSVMYQPPEFMKLYCGLGRT